MINGVHGACAFIHLFSCTRIAESVSINLLTYNKYVGLPYCPAKMSAGYVACCPLVSHVEYTDRTDRRTDGRTSDRYITLSARRG